MPFKDHTLLRHFVSSLAGGSREEITKRMIIVALEGQEVLNERRLIREVLSPPLSEIWGVSRQTIISALEKSLQRIIEMLTLEMTEMGVEIDRERGIELVYENPFERERFASESVKNLRPSNLNPRSGEFSRRDFV